MNDRDDKQPQASLKNLRCCAALVPAWQPQPGFAAFVQDLVAAGFGAVLLVDDGSGSPHAGVFESLRHLPAVVVLMHAVNLGKGRALKTGFNHVLSALPDIDAVVTADSDGQHRVDDIVAVARRSLLADTTLVLGTRQFGNGVPLRNRFGNRLTRVIFRHITGVILADTQTGLRCFPRSMLPQLLVIEGERYEYEMAVLAHICRHGNPVELPIATVYLDGNRSSHFHPLWDSLRIYRVLVRRWLLAADFRS